MRGRPSWRGALRRVGQAKPRHDVDRPRLGNGCAETAWHEPQTAAARQRRGALPDAASHARADVHAGFRSADQTSNYRAAAVRRRKRGAMIINTRFVMKTLSAALVVIAIASAALPAAVTPARALGGCGPNSHRSSVTGRCIWGGQNQGWCLAHTGHPAVRMPNGTMVCVEVIAFARLATAGSAAALPASRLRRAEREEVPIRPPLLDRAGDRRARQEPAPIGARVRELLADRMHPVGIKE